MTFENEPPPTPEERAWIAKLLAEAPPLTQEQRDTIVAILRTGDAAWPPTDARGAITRAMRLREARASLALDGETFAIPSPEDNEKPPQQR